MKVVILAAGEGVRLRPLTDNKPKALVPFLGRTLLERQLKLFREESIKDIFIVGGHGIEYIKSYGIPVIENSRYRDTNMVESLFCAKKNLMGTSDVIVCYGDILFEPRILKALLASKSEISLCADKNWQELWQLRFSDPLSDAETFRMDSKQNVLELGKKPRSLKEIEAQYMGLFKIEGTQVNRFFEFRDTLDKMKLYDGKPFEKMFMTSYLQELIHAHWKVSAVLVESGWLEIDSMDDLKKYEQLSARSALGKFFREEA